MSKSHTNLLILIVLKWVLSCLPEPPEPNELYPCQTKMYILVLDLTFGYPSRDKIIVRSSIRHSVLTVGHIFIDFICLDRASHLVLLYIASLLVLPVYSILYGLPAKKESWLGAITSAAVISLGDLISSSCY